MVTQILQMMSKLYLKKKIKQTIKEWNDVVNRNICRKIDDLKMKIIDMEDALEPGTDLDLLKMELEELKLERDSMLRQQARIS